MEFCRVEKDCFWEVCWVHFLRHDDHPGWLLQTLEAGLEHSRAHQELFHLHSLTAGPLRKDGVLELARMQLLPSGDYQHFDQVTLTALAKGKTGKES